MTGMTTLAKEETKYLWNGAGRGRCWSTVSTNKWLIRLPERVRRTAKPSVDLKSGILNRTCGSILLRKDK